MKVFNSWEFVNFKNFQILKNDRLATLAIFTDNPLISFRRNKNIRDKFVRSALMPAAQATIFFCD